jgi:hypothetical protein
MLGRVSSRGASQAVRFTARIEQLSLNHGTSRSKKDSPTGSSLPCFTCEKTACYSRDLISKGLVDEYASRLTIHVSWGVRCLKFQLNSTWIRY